MNKEDVLMSLYRRGYSETHGLGVPLSLDGEEFIVSFVEENGDPNRFYFGVAACTSRFTQAFRDSVYKAFKNAGLHPENWACNDKWLQWAYLPKDEHWMENFKKLVCECKKIVGVRSLHKADSI